MFRGSADVGVKKAQRVGRCWSAKMFRGMVAGKEKSSEN